MSNNTVQFFKISNGFILIKPRDLRRPLLMDDDLDLEPLHPKSNDNLEKLSLTQRIEVNNLLYFPTKAELCQWILLNIDTTTT